MKSWSIFILIIAVALLAACSTTPEPTIQSTPILTRPATAASTHSAATPYPEPSTAEPDTPYPDTEAVLPSPTSLPAFWIAEYVPAAIVEQVMSQLGDQVDITEDKQAATWQLDVGSDTPFAEWVYVLVAPFPTIADGITGQDLGAAWEGKSSGDFSGMPLMMDEATLGVLSASWGPPAEGAVKIVAGIADPSYKVNFQQPSWAIVPFEQLKPQWKILQIDGVSPIQKGFDLAPYPLTIPFSLTGTLSVPRPPSPVLSNRSPAKFTDVMLTGVTALVRGTALTMERKGITHPGEDIAPLTQAVDFMHVNNEIPFTPGCPFPELYPEFLVFCSDVRYLELLEYIGTDFVEVSGDHFGDHGSDGTLFTLDLYDEAGLPYYGGGRDLEDGRKPLLIEHNDNKIAILGCNAKGSQYYAPADEETPGAVPCDFERMEAEIARLQGEGYLVIVTLQHVEYYSYEAQPNLVRDFGRMAEAGADIISGSQSHQAHGFAFQNNALIHYGLGNLFFDQYLYCENAACDYAFMDRHIIYDGRHISTELIPIRFIDMARPRPMTAEERAWFLDIIFEASGWGE